MYNSFVFFVDGLEVYPLSPPPLGFSQILFLFMEGLLALESKWMNESGLTCIVTIQVYE